METDAISVLRFYMIWFKEGWSRKPGSTLLLCRRQPLKMWICNNAFFQEWMQTVLSQRSHYDRILILSCSEVVDPRTKMWYDKQFRECDSYLPSILWYQTRLMLYCGKRWQECHTMLITSWKVFMDWLIKNHSSWQESRKQVKHYELLAKG